MNLCMDQTWNISEICDHDLILMCYMVQVQPDMEELTENAEDGADEAESKQSEVKLGRLQYKVSSILHELRVVYNNKKEYI